MAKEYETREDLIKQRDELQETVSSFEAKMEAMMKKYQSELESLRSAHGTSYEDNLDNVVVYDDPYENQSAFRVHGEIEPCEEYPEGAVVQWKNPEYRARRTWRGWEPFEWGDQYTGPNGELLNKYIPDPPKALQGPDRIDNYVRRGDAVLARLPKPIFLARQQKRINDSRKNMGLANSGGNTVLADGVELYGPGAKPSHRPSGGFHPRPERSSTPYATVKADGVETEV